METQISIGNFKTHCYSVLNQMQKSNNKLIITKSGAPIAEIIPINIKPKKPIMGMLQGKAKIVGDIISPIDVKWDAES